MPYNGNMAAAMPMPIVLIRHQIHQLRGQHVLNHGLTIIYTCFPITVYCVANDDTRRSFNQAISAYNIIKKVYNDTP